MTAEKYVKKDKYKETKVIFIFSITQPLTKLGSPNLGFWENTSHRTVQYSFGFLNYICRHAPAQQLVENK